MMGRIMIKCPVTGEPVFTGYEMLEESVEKWDIHDPTMGKCPQCGGEHIWQKEDTYFEPEAT